MSNVISERAMQAAHDEIESLRQQLEMVEACLAGDNALIVGLKNDIAEKDAVISRLQFALADTEALELGTAERLAAIQAVNQQLREALTGCVCAMQDYQAGIGITEMFDKSERLGRLALQS